MITKVVDKVINKLETLKTVMDEKVELMYRAPDRKAHQNITEVLDEIMNRLDRIEAHLEDGVERLEVIENRAEELDDLARSVETIEEEGGLRLARIEALLEKN